MRRYFLSFILVGCMMACGNRNDLPGGIIPTKKMEAVLWDVLQADAFTEQFIKKDSSKKAAFEYAQLEQKIFAIHKVSRENFNKSYAWYKAHPAILHVVLDSITAKAERQRSAMMMKKYGDNRTGR